MSIASDLHAAISQLDTDVENDLHGFLQGNTFARSLLDLLEQIIEREAQTPAPLATSGVGGPTPPSVV